MEILNILSALFLLVLIICGAVYITMYERAPIWERVHVFGVGFGMYIGIILLCV